MGSPMAWSSFRVFFFSFRFVSVRFIFSGGRYIKAEPNRFAFSGGRYMKIETKRVRSSSGRCIKVETKRSVL